jgi:hypothetical protein
MSNTKYTKNHAAWGIVVGIVLIIADVALQANGFIFGFTIFKVIPLSAWIVGAILIFFSLIGLVTPDN